MSRDSSVGIAPGCGLDDRGSRVRFPVGARNFSLHHCVQNCSGAHQPPIQWVPGALPLGVKRPGRETDHSPPSSAEVKNEWSYTSTPQYAFMTWCLVKHRDNFTFYLLCSKVCVKIGVPFWHVVTSCFLWLGVVSPSPKPQTGGPLLVGCLWLLIQYICSYLPRLEAVSSIHNLKTCHVVVTGSHIMW
jgi:hypothetical protein